MNIIIYGSKYGTARQYAEHLGRQTNTEVKAFDDINDINTYNTIVYIGALYAGGVMGMKETLSKIDTLEDKKLVIATVGLADPDDPQNIETIRDNIKRQLPATLYEHADIYHLRGGIDYSRLSLKHKTMMWMLYKKTIKIPESERNAEVRAMLETYGKKVNFVDMKRLECLTDYLKPDQ